MSDTPKAGFAALCAYLAEWREIITQKQEGAVTVVGIAMWVLSYFGIISDDESARELGMKWGSIVVGAVALVWVPYVMYRRLQIKHLGEINALSTEKAALCSKLSPKLIISCPQGDGLSRVHDNPSILYLRATVTNVSALPVQGCTAYLNKVLRDGKPLTDGLPRKLTFAPSDDADAQSKVIPPSQPFAFDVVVVFDNPRVLTATKPRSDFTSKSRDEGVSPGAYELEVSVSGVDCAPHRVMLNFLWSGDLATTTLSFSRELG